jgi:DNA-binding NtrC family response regulator
VRTARNLKQARAKIEATAPDVILTDLVLPDGSGLDLFEDLESSPPTDVVLVTDHATVETAVKALRQGATDYLSKPLDVTRLKAVLGGIVRARELLEEIGCLRNDLRTLGRFGLLIGNSPAMQQIYDLIGRVAPTDASVFVTGESGTGKEVVARTIHDLSQRRKGPYVPVNCAAISETLIESELFGHEKGSFTGADKRHIGKFEQASGGTIFLDEVSEMSLDLQTKLLRVLETGLVVRVGGTESIEVDARVISATNRPPDRIIDDGLREDLYYRLNVFPIHLPPLRDRGEDIKLLAESFLAELNRDEAAEKTLTVDGLERLQAHSWPGNVRELKNALHRAFILADARIDASCIPLDPAGVTGECATTSLHLRVGSSIAEAERRLIIATLAVFDGDKKRAAETLGISLKTLYNRLKVYGA